ncbi:glucosamine-6-phosphate deaminase [Aquamicrobium sp. LC103]|uniref:glucosamine-6-phosphate deaminase n=1 Tax=Aquamicrobium sp. LC103 TaxID=1120658 RepID=UPI00069C4F30|nr:glucosamine-6-phosphate deaminase [Aquamicrobium sp. LC103]TKT75693.1 glucosamine-6-phosphate deaminase [Aquamicrobium sp. LC103]
MTAQLARKPENTGVMEIIRCDSSAQAERETAATLRRYITRTAKPALGLATGRTMLPVYAWFREWYRDGELSFANSTSFNLDEYCGLASDDPSNFVSYMRRNLFNHVDMEEGRFHFPEQTDPEAFDARIGDSGGIGLQLLGIGRNGHIGFNEPGADRNSRTHVVTLTESTRNANAGDFPAGTPVPEQAVTMGIATILEAQRIVLLATGNGKADILKRAFHGPVSSDCPASYLQLHNHVTVICDGAAAAHLGEPS